MFQPKSVAVSILLLLTGSLSGLSAQAPPVPVPVPVPSEPPSPAAITSYLNRLLDTLETADQFSGSVLIAKDGEAIYRRAVGEANKSYRVPNRMDTKFNLGSMNKMFTGVAIMQLVQQGRLAVTDTVGKHLPDYPNPDVRDRVTIHQLLTHTSGMGLYWRQFFTNPNWAQLKSVADFDNLSNTEPLAFEPGSAFSYSNAGPLVLGLIIEAVSGQSYDDYIRESVTGPAGMVNTDCYDISQPVENLALGYAKMSPFGERYEDWHNNLFINPVKGGPAGGGYSTAEDLLKFARALESNVLLDQEHYTLMTTGKVDFTAGERTVGLYGYLFGDREYNGHRVVGHSGGAAGIASFLEMFVDLGYTVIAMSNYDMGSTPIVRAMRDWLTRDE